MNSEESYRVEDCRLTPFNGFCPGDCSTCPIFDPLFEAGDKPLHEYEEIQRRLIESETAQDRSSATADQ